MAGSGGALVGDGGCLVVGRFGLFDAIDERHSAVEPFVTPEPTPALLRALTELERQAQDVVAGQQPRVLSVHSRTVAKVDSIGLVVRIDCQCGAGES